MFCHSALDFPPRNELLSSQTEAKNSFRSGAEGCGVIVVYVSLDRGELMLASKAFSSTVHDSKPAQEEAVFLFPHCTNGNPEEGTVCPRSQIQTFPDIC